MEEIARLADRLLVFPEEKLHLRGLLGRFRFCRTDQKIGLMCLL